MVKTIGVVFLDYKAVSFFPILPLALCQTSYKSSKFFSNQLWLVKHHYLYACFPFHPVSEFHPVPYLHFCHWYYSQFLEQP